ncbi:Uncharacterised protein [uncultured archaeon]|nr:Uncharacterised protein [uncultured archaeon]
MTRFIALLRGINVGGPSRSVPMADLRQLLEKLGFTNVQTYIQSGNVILDSALSPSSVQKKIEEAMEARFGFAARVMVLTPAKLSAILKANPFSKRSGIEDARLYFTLLEKPPEPAHVAQLKAIDGKGDELSIQNDVVYIFCPNGYGRSAYSNPVVEKTLKVSATTRNLATMKKLEELAQA